MDNVHRKTIEICSKTIAQLAEDMEISPGTARHYLKKIGMERPANGGNIYSPNEVEKALRKLGYL